jgi:hypothetical protein
MATVRNEVMNQAHAALGNAAADIEQLRRERDARPNITIAEHQRLIQVEVDLEVRTNERNQARQEREARPTAVQLATAQAQRDARPNITVEEHQQLLRNLAAVQEERDQAIRERDQARQERDALARDFAANIGMTEAEFLLVESAERGDITSIERSLGMGANINVIDKRPVNRTTWPGASATPLNLAAANRQLDAVNYLLNRGADIWTRDLPTRCTPMHNAARNNDIRMMNVLLDRNTEIIEALDHTNFTPLHYAAYKGHANAVRWLLEHGANRNAVTSDYKSRYHFRKTPYEIAVDMHADREVNLEYDRTEVLRVFNEIPIIPGNLARQPGIQIVNQFNAAREGNIPAQLEQQPQQPAPAAQQAQRLAPVL